MEKKIVELRQMGYTWNQIDQMLLEPSQIVRKNGKIVSKCFKIAKKKNLSEAFSKAVIGAYTATQIVRKIRTFNPFTQTQVAEMIEADRMA